MARVRSCQPLLPSLLDRLMDEDPAARFEPVKPVGALLRDIKANLRRDLEWLLNTRRSQPEQVLDRYPELRHSLMAYGLPDFSGVPLGSAEHRETFRATVQSTIKRLEPRLSQVLVEMHPIGAPEERTLYLRITAMLLVEPDPVPLLLDSRIQAQDRTVRLRELRHG